MWCVLGDGMKGFYDVWLYPHNPLSLFFSQYFLTKRTLSDMERPEQLERIRHEFREADKNHNGSIDLDELLVVAKALGEPLSFEEASEALVGMDTNNDGRVEEDELLVFWLAAPLEDGE